jgi:hypothetical protein
VENSIPLSIFPIAMDKYCIAFCGLPGRGKTHISRRLARYLEFFISLPVQIFNVTEYRRKLETDTFRNADFFDPFNEEAKKLRTHFNKLATEDLVTFLQAHSNGVAILDATNTSHERRMNLVNAVRPTGAKVPFSRCPLPTAIHCNVLTCLPRTNAQVIFIEVSNSDEKFLSDNYRYCATTSPEYDGIDPAAAVADYKRRIDNYTLSFEPINPDLKHPIESKWSYFKCDHSLSHFEVHRIRGNLPLKIVQFIMNMRTTSHSFYLSRHGQVRAQRGRYTPRCF